MNKTLSEILLTLSIVVLAVLLLDPFMILLPGSTPMYVILALIVIFLIYIMFLWKENAKDEREEENILRTNRLVWLSGSSVLIAGITYEGLISHQVDVWIILSLVTMVVSKIIARKIFNRVN